MTNEFVGRTGRGVVVDIAVVGLLLKLMDGTTINLSRSMMTLPCHWKLSEKVLLQFQKILRCRRIRN